MKCKEQIAIDQELEICWINPSKDCPDVLYEWIISLENFESFVSGYYPLMCAYGKPKILKPSGLCRVWLRDHEINDFGVGRSAVRCSIELGKPSIPKSYYDLFRSSLPENEPLINTVQKFKDLFGRLQLYVPECFDDTPLREVKMTLLQKRLEEYVKTHGGDYDHLPSGIYF